MARWSYKYKSSLPDNHFLVVERGGRKDERGRTRPNRLRHFPVISRQGLIDVEHVRSALARIGRSGVSDHAKGSARKKAKALLEYVHREVDRRQARGRR
jgi:hypothetical protein